MKLRIDNYAIIPSKFIAGTRGSYGIEPIELEFSEEWDGLSVAISFYPSVGDPVNILYTGRHFFVPEEVMNVSGPCKFVISGYHGAKRLITAEGILRVLNTSKPTDNPALEPTPDLFSQMMTVVGDASSVLDGRPQSYAPATGECNTLTVGAAHSLTGDNVVTREALLSEDTVAGGEQPVKLFSGRLSSIDGMTINQLLENGNFVDTTGWSAAASLLRCDNYTAQLTISPQGAREAGRSISADLSLTVGTPYTHPDSEILQKYLVTSSEPTVAAVTPSDGALSLTPLAKGMTTIHFEPLSGVYTVPPLDLLVSVNSAKPEKTSMPYPGITSTTHSIKSGSANFVSARVKSSADANISLKLDTLKATRSQKTDEWTPISSIISLATTKMAAVSIIDDRRVKVSGTATGGYYSGIVATNNSRLLAVAGAHSEGKYVLTFTNTEESGWVLTYEDGQTLPLSPEHCGLRLKTSSSATGSPVGSVITVTITNPFNSAGTATIKVPAQAGLDAISLNANKFAGCVEGGSGTYSLRYISGHWYCEGRPVLLSKLGFTYLEVATPAEGATITVNLTQTPETMQISSVQLGSVGLLGLSSYNYASMVKIYGSCYHHCGITHTSIAGIRCLDSSGEVIDGGMYFSEPITLRRMPDGTADTLDLDRGILTRRVGAQVITGQTGDLFTLKNAQSESAVLSEYETVGESIGSVSDGVLRLSRTVNAVEVYYLLETPQESEVSLPSTYRVCSGGTEQLITLEDEKYIAAPVGSPVKLSYSLDVWHQCMSNHDKLTALMVALGLEESSDSGITALAEQISSALAGL